MSEKHPSRPRVVVAYASEDLGFVEQLGRDLRRFGVETADPGCEIGGDETGFAATLERLAARDALVIVLSPASAETRWLHEASSPETIHRLSAADVHLLPVLHRTCEVPLPLERLGCADFTGEMGEGLSHLLDLLAPDHLLWRPLAQLHDQVCGMCDRISSNGGAPGPETGDRLQTIQDLLETAFDLRTQAELRKVRQRLRDRALPERSDAAEETPEIAEARLRSPAWTELFEYRSKLGHDLRSHQAILQNFAYVLRQRLEMTDLAETLASGMGELKTFMRRICFDRWSREPAERRPG